jgi:hypothetical protein
MAQLGFLALFCLGIAALISNDPTLLSCYAVLSCHFVQRCLDFS